MRGLDRINRLMQTSKEYHIGKLISEIATRPEIKKATKFLSPKLVIKATRRNKYDGREKSEVLIVTLGAPNFREKRYIETLKEAKVPFPVRRIRIKWEK